MNGDVERKATQGVDGPEKTGVNGDGSDNRHIKSAVNETFVGLTKLLDV